MKSRLFAATIAILALAHCAPAQAEIHYDIRAGIGIGGIAPLPFPEEIREIYSYSPGFQPSIQAGMSDMLSPEWGVRTALRLETKGMSTSARVKNYSMSITGDDGSSLYGFWTGDVDTDARNFLLTVPVSAVYKMTDRLSLDFGPYLSLLLGGDFSGEVSDGYLREGSPIGDKVVFENGATSSYDFSDSYSRCQFGLSLGADYRINDEWFVSAALDWGLTDVFKSSFKTITFDMYPICVRLSVGYRF